MLATTAAETIHIPTLIDAVTRGDAPQVEATLAPLRLPEQDLLTGVYFMRDGFDVESRLMGVQALANHMRSHGDVRMAADLTLALVHVFEKQGDFEDDQLPEPQRLMVANVVDVCANALTDAGRIAELLDAAPRWSAWLDRAGLTEQWRSVQRAWVQGSFHAGSYEMANGLLKELLRRFPGSDQLPIERRLLDKLDDLLRRVDKPDTPSATLQWILQRTLEELGGSGGLPSRLVEDIGKADVNTAVDRIGATIGLRPPPDTSGLAEAVKLLPRAASPLHEIGNVVEKLAESLADGQLEPAAVAALADEARQHAIGYRFWEEASSLGWLRSVALRRAHALDGAAAELAQLRQSVRERQGGIRDPLLRAALGEYLPHLWAVSAQVLFDLGPARSEELFGVIEEAKGRILSALTYGELAAPEPQLPLARVRNLLRNSSRRSSYLAFLADQDKTYAAHVDSGGTLRTVRLAFGRVHLAAAANELSFLVDGEPSSLVRSAGIDQDHPFERDFGPPLRVLAPLGQWLATLFDAGVLQEDEVLCLSPDGPMYNLPLAVLEVAGKLLLERVALTLVPSADVLDWCARLRPGRRRDRAFALAVPLATEFDAALYDAELFMLDATTIARHWKATIPPPALSDPDRLLAEDLTELVVHLAAHGRFDAAAPLEGSGLLLASGGELPAGRGHDGRRGVLTPMAASRLKARGAHITLRACVSGKTTEVTSREALGMIWALLQAGASSLLAASWDVDLRSAARLLDHFYQRLAVDESPPVALRSAALRIRGATDTWSHPYHFAAFNAFGYWN